VHQIVRGAIEDHVPVVQHKKVGFWIEVAVRVGNHVVLSTVEVMCGQRKGVLKAVGDQQRTGVVNITLLHDQLNDGGRSDRVQASGRRIVEDKVGAVDDGAGNGHTAAHTAGEL
jgi:hypothetical protein